MAPPAFLKGIEIWAEDEAGARLPAGGAGALCLRGPSVMLGYLDDPAATARVLSNDGVLRTGDIGFVGAEGAVYVEGRGDGVVKIAGERVGVESVAESLRATPGVVDIAVVALADELLGAKLFAFIEGSAGARRSKSRGARAPSCAAAFANHPARSASANLAGQDRSAGAAAPGGGLAFARERARRGRRRRGSRAHGGRARFWRRRMNIDSIEEVVRELLTSHVAPPARDDTPLELASLSMVALAEELEQEFGFVVAARELTPENFKTVASIVSYVVQRRSGA